MPKTLAEIAIDAGLVNKASAARAGKMAEERKEPLVVMLVRELGVDELQLVSAFGKQTRVQVMDPKTVAIDPEAMRSVPRDVAMRLRLLPLGLTTDGKAKVLKVAMADPTDTAAIAELESLVHAEIDVSALPLSTIEELVDKGYRQFSTAVQSRPKAPVPTGVTAGGKSIESGTGAYQESEVSVTAQIPLVALQAPDDIETRLTALVQVLVGKGLITEVELTEALVKLKSSQSP